MMNSMQLPTLPPHEFVELPISVGDHCEMFNKFNAIIPEVATLMQPHEKALGNVFADLCAYGFNPRDVANVLIAEIGVLASEFVLNNSMVMRNRGNDVV